MKKLKIKKIELLAPAGNLEKMKTAFAFGADAIYLGIPDFSLRVRINDFDLAGVKEAVKYAHELGKKVYVTINIFAHNKHLDKLPPYLKELKKIKVDALIISDPGVLVLAKKIWPACEIHLSTQANCTNWQAVKFWRKAGVKRIILGRETTLDEIKEIHRRAPEMELEYFVHGAMCMAYSGRCFLSKYFNDRSANLGDCTQPCRWPYGVESRSAFAKASADKKLKVESKEYFIAEEKRFDQPLEIVEEEHGSYILNSKDLCLIKYLDKLVDAGVTSFKIEGRAKSVYYEAMVNGIYSHVTHNIKHITKKDLDYFYNELDKKLVHRGYTTGFLLGGKADQELKLSHQSSKWEFCGQVISHSTYHIARNRILVKVHNTVKVGDEIEIVRPFYDIIKMRVEKLVDIKNNKEISEAHGGSGGQTVILEVGESVPEYSVLRRKVESRK
ncbi:MAG: U32 family peptidase C-terminal domain-containing protein [Patescibacteria group bacterium]|nr:U32 family peptidase C-terminal domain-containing protein [Patescibacteria group bacterium]MDD4611343.1 U32 family peptidase C-terminal domain-containing protein [Patescibacteria group bacterium]